MDLQIAATNSLTDKQTHQINKPLLWSTDKPMLYTLRTEIFQQQQLLQQQTSFGIRRIHVDAETVPVYRSICRER